MIAMNMDQKLKPIADKHGKDSTQKFFARFFASES